MSDEETKAEEKAETATPADLSTEASSDAKEEETKAEETATPKEESKGDDINLSKNAEKILDMVKELPVLELANLVKAMEEEFGVSAVAPVAMMAGGGGGEDAGGAEEKTAFDVELISPGGSKINVIKAVREITGLGLKEAKDLVDGAPKVVKEGVKKEEAEELKTRLEEAGASVEIK